LPETSHDHLEFDLVEVYRVELDDNESRMGFSFFASRVAARFLEDIRHPAGVSTAALLLIAVRCRPQTLSNP
jgi:hypothetical protein